MEETSVLQRVEELLERQQRQMEQWERLLALPRLQLAEWLTIEHAAIVSDCSYDHIYRAVERGELPATDIGNGEKKAAYRIARSDLTSWMGRNKGGTAAVPPRAALGEVIDRHLPGLRGRKASAAR